MGRTMLAEGDVFRVKIVRRAWQYNPDFHYFRNPDVPRRIYSGETVTTYAGPYKSRGSAAGQRIALACCYDRDAGEYVLREDILSATIQRARTTWEDVE
ncbi:hypothetical protein ACFVHB_20155 [Kitasatospora sp. NPDC127111]|uniref:hypothetical protein n=1 Tax=Kitasatospora sp. NPDC127111 TaxID=3345363 RepID=UPI003645E162